MSDTMLYVDDLGDPCPESPGFHPYRADVFPMTYRDVLHAVLTRLRSSRRISVDGDEACALAFPCYLFQHLRVAE